MKQAETHSKIKHYVSCFIHSVNLSHHIAYHLIGPNHTPVHRKTIGVVIMLVAGTVIGLFTELSHSIISNILINVIGNGLHGIGLMPFINDVEKSIEHKIVNN